MPPTAETQVESEEQYPDHELRDPGCGYKWTYTGTLWRATCPRCGSKVKTQHYPDGT